MATAVSRTIPLTRDVRRLRTKDSFYHSEEGISDTRVVFSCNPHRDNVGYQTIITLKDNSDLVGAIVRVFGSVNTPEGAAQVLLTTHEITALQSPDLPSEGATGFVGETILLQDPWGHYDTLSVDIDCTGAGGVDYDIDLSVLL